MRRSARLDQWSKKQRSRVMLPLLQWDSASEDDVGQEDSGSRTPQRRKPSEAVDRVGQGSSVTPAPGAARTAAARAAKLEKARAKSITTRDHGAVAAAQRMIPSAVGRASPRREELGLVDAVCSRGWGLAGVPGQEISLEPDAVPAGRSRSGRGVRGRGNRGRGFGRRRGFGQGHEAMRFSSLRAPTSIRGLFPSLSPGSKMEPRSDPAPARVPEPEPEPEAPSPPSTRRGYLSKAKFVGGLATFATLQEQRGSKCSVCDKRARFGYILLRCSTCGSISHPKCMGIATPQLERTVAADPGWQCTTCKSCMECHRKCATRVRLPLEFPA